MRSCLPLAALRRFLGLALAKHLCCDLCRLCGILRDFPAAKLTIFFELMLTLFPFLSQSTRFSVFLISGPANSPPIRFCAVTKTSVHPMRPPQALPLSPLSHFKLSQVRCVLSLK